VVDVRHDAVKDVFQPGAVQQLEINDGILDEPFASATLEVVAAEALLPIADTPVTPDARER
jgi:hypothetical protein